MLFSSRTIALSIMDYPDSKGTPFFLDIKHWYFLSKLDSEYYALLMYTDPPIFLAILKAAALRL